MPRDTASLRRRHSQTVVLRWSLPTKTSLKSHAVPIAPISSFLGPRSSQGLICHMTTFTYPHGCPGAPPMPTPPLSPPRDAMPLCARSGPAAGPTSALGCLPHAELQGVSIAPHPHGLVSSAPYKAQIGVLALPTLLYTWSELAVICQLPNQSPGTLFLPSSSRMPIPQLSDSAPPRGACTLGAGTQETSK